MSAPEASPYDPYIPSGSSSTNPTGATGVGGAQGAPQKTPITLLQAQIDDTTQVMRENINKVTERGERLDSLQDKTDNLATSAQGFRRGANRVRKQMWWKDMRMRLLIIAGIIILIIIIVVPIVKAVKK